METRRWTNPSQPQTLQIAVFLLYIDAVFGVLFGSVFSAIGLLLVIGQVASGFGIANEKRWAYWLGVAVATLGLLPFVPGRRGRRGGRDLEPQRADRPGVPRGAVRAARAPDEPRLPAHLVPLSAPGAPARPRHHPLFDAPRPARQTLRP